MRYSVTTLVLLMAVLTGCHNSEQPRLRISSYFGSIGGMDFPVPDNLGQHNYVSQWGENMGMVYTCGGGFIDLGHVREAADRTYYASTLIYKNIMGGNKQIVFRVIEPSQYRLALTYPSDWYLKTPAQRQAIARDVSLKLGQQIGHTSLIWHEIITWFGWASTGLFSEQISSFSWEDTYSDVLGTTLAIEAMKQDRPYNEAMTDVLYAALRRLDVQPPEVAKKAFDQVQGEWFEGGFYFFVKMNKRNFDVGFDTGEVTPWLVPDICPDRQPIGCPIPRPQASELQGFTAALTLNPMVSEKKKLYQLLAFDNERWIKPAEDFPTLLHAIVQQAEEKYGSQVGVPYTLHLGRALTKTEATSD